jgi:GTP cyclohydrolase II
MEVQQTMLSEYQIATANLPTEFGLFTISVFELDASQVIVLTCGDLNPSGALVRIHSECLTGDVLGSLRCDCRYQLLTSLRMIGEAGEGCLVYLRQEGRGIGLFQKILAYKLQEAGVNTIQANLQLGLPVDARNYELAIEILKSLGLRSVKLITNNPDKVNALTAAGLEVMQRVPIQTTANTHNRAYMEAKHRLMGHFLNLE